MSYNTRSAVLDSLVNLALGTFDGALSFAQNDDQTDVRQQTHGAIQDPSRTPALAGVFVFHTVPIHRDPTPPNHAVGSDDSRN